MIIRVDKCSTFGIRKLCTKSVQYLPKLLINGVLIPCVEMSESFRYLGRFFDFNMSNNQHMSELSSLVQDLMNDIDIKPLHPKHKLLLYSRYVLSKLSWNITIANKSKTWITEHLDPVVNGYIRKWLDIPISGILSNVFLERNKFGLNIFPPSIKFTQCQTVLRNSLKESPNHSLKDLWKSSSCHTNSGAPRAKRAYGAPWVNKSTHRRKFNNHVTDRTTVRPHHRHTNVYSHTF